MACVSLRPEKTLSSGVHQHIARTANLLLESTSITRESDMARKPRDYDAELQALMERAKKVKTQKTTQLGELVQVIGADSLPIEALAGVLLSALDDSKSRPETVARWTERGQAFFQQDTKRGKKATSGEPAPATTGNGSSAPATERAAQ
jgi:hypothetical protein